jgi:hypothetical protein
MAWLYLAAKPSHMRVDVNGLANPLQCPMTRSRHTRGMGLLQVTGLFHPCSGWWCLSVGCEAPGLGYLV